MNAIEVDIWFLFCESPQATGPGGRDAVRLLWNDVAVWTGELSTGENWGSLTGPLHVIRTLTDPAILKLVVQPIVGGSVPDEIGSVPLDPQTLNSGEHLQRFDVRGARYELSYRAQPTQAPPQKVVEISFLFCQSPQEPGADGMDVVRLLWNDEEVWNGELTWGENWGSHVTPAPNVIRSLTGPATLKLIVRPTAEGSVPDLIATEALDPDSITLGFHTVPVDVRGAKYEITYQVR